MTTKVTTAMVMAAGMGKRMRPLTATRPKPLVDVAGQALLDHCLDRVEEAGVTRAVVNVHYLPEQVEAHIKRRAKARGGKLEIVTSDERDQLLETGGGVVKALPLIEGDPFYVVNSDNIWINGPSNSLLDMAKHWDPETMDALIMLVPSAQAHCHGGSGDFHMDKLGRVTRKRPNRAAPYVYSGCQLTSRSFFSDPPEGPFSTNILWDRAIKAGRLYGYVHSGLWFEINTPSAIGKSEAIMAHG